MRSNVSLDSSNVMVMASKADSRSVGKNQKKERPIFSHCKMLGHTVDKCYKLHEFPPGYKTKSKTQANAANVEVAQIEGSLSKAELDQSLSAFTAEQCQQLINMLPGHLKAYSSSSTDVNSATFNAGTCFSVDLASYLNFQNCWIVDSGASRHICTNRSLFLNLKPLRNSNVTLPNNVMVSVEYIGDVRLSQDLLLMDVLYVPGFKSNLISISALTAALLAASLFHNAGFVIQDTQNSRTISKGIRVHDLYVLEVENSSVTASVNKVSAQEWHDRLGYISFKRL